MSSIDIRCAQMKKNKRKEYKQKRMDEEENAEQISKNEKWRCMLCNYRNKATSMQCVMCDKPKDKKRKSEESNHNLEPAAKKQKVDHQDGGSWTCKICTFENIKSSLSCSMCHIKKDAKDENISKQLHAQMVALQKSKNSSTKNDSSSNDLLNDSFDVGEEIVIKSSANDDDDIKISQPSNIQKRKRRKSMKEEMDSNDDDSDNDVALDMFKNGLTPNVVRHATKKKIITQSNDDDDDDCFDVDPSMDALLFTKTKYNTFNDNQTANKQMPIQRKSKQSNNLFFELSVSDYLKQSGFTC